ncbi:hypothetical protein BEWA_028860 [Theileria equi strain WA]|uniref:Signal peptide containing protein n=1 Tax=Theileria equi strain WA TaxID=1537102 RepID=L0AYE7_THEEQ|nr:hypothetical protein BEWA_028860 [Theileria equi strain WA]AFZ80036.1 hypothetical protein BEWA_028860 [Theileria equi strain WA]|eukprot:XP_004829702.1 hypothetical protein BEWA_028860 [Theileria equi strain WA]
MRILILLYTICILRHCSCGDVNEPKGTPDVSSGTIDQPSPNTTQDTINEQNAEYKDSLESSKDEKTTSDDSKEDSPNLSGKDEPIQETQRDSLKSEGGATGIGRVVRRDAIPINTAQAVWETGLRHPSDSPDDQEDGEKERRRQIERVMTSSSLEKFLQAEAAKSKAASTSPGCTLDIAKLNPSLCKLHEYYYDSHHIALIVPKEEVTVTGLVQAKFPIWIAKPGEFCEFSKLYLNKDNKPDLVLVAKRSASGVSARWYAKSLGVWVKWKNVEERINKLSTFIDRPATFVMNMDDTDDLPHCTIFDAKILGAQARLYFPKPGYYATEVKSGDVSIWKAEKGDKCMACDLYSRDGEPLFALISIRNEEGKTYRRFGRRDQEWNEMTEKEFNELRQELTTVKLAKSSTTGFIITPPTSPPPSRHSSIEASEDTHEAGSKKGFGSLRRMWKERREDIRSISKRIPSKEVVATYVGRKVNTFGRRIESLRRFRRPPLRAVTGDKEDTEEFDQLALINTQKEDATGVSTQGATLPDEQQTDASQTTIDLSNQDGQIYNSFFHHGESIPTVLIVPCTGVFVNEIVNGDERIWKAENGMSLDYSKLYMNSDNSPELIFIISSNNKGLDKRHFGLQNGKWVDCSDTYIDRLNDLRIAVDTTVDITINVEDAQDTENCTIFDAEICRVPIRSYIPNLGFNANKLVHNGEILWTASETEELISCIAYLKDGEPFLIIIKMFDSGEKTQKCYEKDENGWNVVDKATFDKKRSELIP